jgi:putative membrane protein insertion efficiency factor
MFRFITLLPRRLFQLLIRGYQKTLSPDHGPLSRVMKYPTCRYHPTCSAYAHEAIGKHGVIKGGAMALWRILRCNPWSKGGHDPVR